MVMHGPCGPAAETLTLHVTCSASHTNSPYAMVADSIKAGLPVLEDLHGGESTREDRIRRNGPY